MTPGRRLRAEDLGLNPLRPPAMCCRGPAALANEAGVSGTGLALRSSWCLLRLVCHRCPRRPCHKRAIHNSRERSRADTHGQSHGRSDLCRSLPGQVTILPDLALGAEGHTPQTPELLACPVAVAGSGHERPERQTGPRSDGPQPPWAAWPTAPPRVGTGQQMGSEPPTQGST
jgi:hypothetical protein